MRPEEIAQKLIPQLEARQFGAEFAATGADAKATILKRIPKGATVMAGSSTTLDQIGVTDALRGGDYDYLRAKIQSENDPEKRHELRRRAILAPFHLGSVAAITEDGVLMAADNSGSRVAGYIAGPERVIIAASVNKVVSDIHDAMRRVRDVAVPREQARVNAGPVHYPSHPNKWVILEGEPRAGRTHVVLIGEPYGF